MRLAVLAVLLLPLAACSATPLPGGLASAFSQRLDTQAGVVDSVAAASIISDLRRARGLGPVTVSPSLTAIAQNQANAMAARDRVSHSLTGGLSFPRRLAAGGYEAEVATENIGAGYPTLAEAFSAWRASPQHLDNMLKSGVTEIGIATAYAPESRYKIFWALVLAAPDQRPAVARR